MEKMEAVGVFIKHNDKFLFIKRGENRNNPNLWALPGGRVEVDETPIAAGVRETAEEVGININTQKILSLGSIQIRFPDQEVNFHLFFTEFPEQPNVKFPPEEITDAEFLSFEEVLNRPFILGLDEAINVCRRYL